MQEFVEKLKENRKQLIDKYVKTNNKETLKEIFIIQNIIVNISLENQYTESGNLIKEMTEEVGKMDLSKLDMTELINQLGVK